jgi:hypothetical protein
VQNDEDLFWFCCYCNCIPLSPLSNEVEIISVKIEKESKKKKMNEDGSWLAPVCKMLFFFNN